jgi:hypothetical protein
MNKNAKNFLNLGKGYLSLLYLKCQYEQLGEKPPEDLKNGITILEQQIQRLTKPTNNS